MISNDNYLIAERTDCYLGLAMSADLTRSLAGGGPWLLMEHSTSAVSWQPRNIAKRPGEMRRNSLAHLARGADGVLFFQWRASRFGAEKHHSAMLPQGGTNTRVWREVVELGAELASPGRPARHRRRAGHRAAVGLGVVVGAGARMAAERGPRLPGAGQGLVRGVHAGPGSPPTSPTPRPT